MKVYVVEGYFDWEGGEVLGVYKDKQSADDLAQEKETEWDGTFVTEFEMK